MRNKKGEHVITMVRNNGTYTVYGDDGKVVIISSDRGLCIAYAKQLKGVITNG
jgi:hypothetical protein